MYGRKNIKSYIIDFEDFKNSVFKLLSSVSYCGFLSLLTLRACFYIICVTVVNR